MKKQRYEIDPSALLKVVGYSDLGFADKGIYGELMSLMWLSESQFSVPFDNLLQEAIGVDCDQLKESVERLTSIGLLVESFSFEQGVVLISPDLESQVKDFKKWTLAQSDIAERREMDRKRNTVSGRIDLRESCAPKTYLSPKERDMSSYKNWLPTNRFDSSGQVYVVRDIFLRELMNQYQGYNVIGEVEKIFHWLVSNPHRRKPLAVMNSFIMQWICRAQSIDGPWKFEGDVVDDFDKAFDSILVGLN